MAYETKTFRLKFGEWTKLSVINDAYTIVQSGGEPFRVYVAHASVPPSAKEKGIRTTDRDFHRLSDTVIWGSAWGEPVDVSVARVIDAGNVQPS